MRPSAEPEVAERDDRVPVTPRRDVLLVQQVADAGLDRRFPGRPLDVPGPPSSPELETRTSGFCAVIGPDEAEAERRVVGMAGGVERNRRVAGSLVRGVGESGYIDQVWPPSKVTCARERTVSLTWPPGFRPSW